MHRPLLLAALLCAAQAHAQANDSAPVPRSAGLPYAAGKLADRIVLTPGQNASTQMAVSYRTDLAQADAVLELGPALAGPSLAAKASPQGGSTQRLDSDNGPANYHQVRLDHLQADTAYVYRLKGSAGWSEWHQFRTAKATFAPFSFIYLGDTQNDILAIASRTIRQALRSVAHPALVVHAGDLVASRDDLAHDDEWGEWNQAGGWSYAAIPQLTAFGNHEYLETLNPDGSESRSLSPHVPAQFALPRNGAPGVEATSYFSDYQNVRFVVLDGTSALDLGTLQAQTGWLEEVLKSSKAQWNIVVMHQPVYTCARPDDTEPLKAAWQPLLERYKVDLVLQGHDHCYSRLTHAEGRQATRTAQKAKQAIGPVYMVSVTGSKMYGLNDRARHQPDRTAEDTQLYQTVAVEQNRLQVRTYSADDQLYDAFDITRDAKGRKFLQEPKLALANERYCNASAGPDGLPCTARDK
ncbi:MAG: metallophosphoesterase family protein [Candidatus Pseudomonas phytovorans]|uniref:Metallophosphoesterase family protein n=1 Tax=Candidatus Pseudomonas phytovorans TaxID=3121377 RepID=A0AAJ5WFP8_9PSED|nr:metallophosphoesterase family protein [Pseudomonas sp.]WEK28904.1 MAG: metallophosphoesterase family protein [Pseudomonas sp.]